ncbi:bZIP transcription factor [Paenibacillus sonchi]|uniref:bZIP transcription factor n=1 Tax=Paenibacillus sonchi TaxID=373687 RepID=UPI001E3199DD|nr:bZIP transcription factor [Paenibacillus sonchi]MCE3201051.1 bZIP transcription factor [Paenibacillus sonchi]
MEWSTLFVLVCPLMMIVMMFIMKGGHAHGSQNQPVAADSLQDQLLDLKAENEQIRKELQNLKK